MYIQEQHEKPQTNINKQAPAKKPIDTEYPENKNNISKKLKQNLSMLAAKKAY